MLLNTYQCRALSLVLGIQQGQKPNSFLVEAMNRKAGDTTYQVATETREWPGRSQPGSREDLAVKVVTVHRVADIFREHDLIIFHSSVFLANFCVQEVRLWDCQVPVEGARSEPMGPVALFCWPHRGCGGTQSWGRGGLG